MHQQLKDLTSEGDHSARPPRVVFDLNDLNSPAIRIDHILSLFLPEKFALDLPQGMVILPRHYIELSINNATNSAFETRTQQLRIVPCNHEFGPCLSNGNVARSVNSSCERIIIIHSVREL